MPPKQSIKMVLVHCQISNYSIFLWVILEFLIVFQTDFSPPSIFHIPADLEPDKQLTDWLKELGADADTIDKVGYYLHTQHPYVASLPASIRSITMHDFNLMVAVCVGL